MACVPTANVVGWYAISNTGRPDAIAEVYRHTGPTACTPNGLGRHRTELIKNGTNVSAPDPTTACTAPAGCTSNTG